MAVTVPAREGVHRHAEGIDVGVGRQQRQRGFAATVLALGLVDQRQQRRLAVRGGERQVGRLAFHVGVALRRAEDHRDLARALCMQVVEQQARRLPEWMSTYGGITAPSAGFFGRLADGHHRQAAAQQVVHVHVARRRLDDQRAVHVQQLHRHPPGFHRRRQHQRQAAVERRRGRHGRHFHHEAQPRRPAGHRERHRRQQHDHVRLAGAQPLRIAVGPVAQLQRRLLDARAGFGIDLAPGVERVRDGGRRHARFPRHVLDVCPRRWIGAHPVDLFEKR
jgi:hypothetical protein